MYSVSFSLTFVHIHRLKVVCCYFQFEGCYSVVIYHVNAYLDDFFPWRNFTARLKAYLKANLDADAADFSLASVLLAL
jgi:hypothetical protein